MSFGKFNLLSTLFSPLSTDTATVGRMAATEATCQKWDTDVMRNAFAVSDHMDPNSKMSTPEFIASVLHSEQFRSIGGQPEEVAQTIAQYHRNLIKYSRKNPDDTFIQELKRAMLEQAMQTSLPLPVLPAGWAADKDFKALGSLSKPNQRNIEPVGPHFLAHARRVSTVTVSP